MISIEVVLGAIVTVTSGVVAAGLAKKWCWGYQLRDMEKDRNLWRGIALRSMDHVDTTAEDALVLVRTLSNSMGAEPAQDG